jgi:hypothetical protein
MYCCIYNTETKEIAHARFITKDLDLEWPMYELECANRGGYWLAYKGEVPYTFPVEAPID